MGLERHDNGTNGSNGAGPSDALLDEVDDAIDEAQRAQVPDEQRIIELLRAAEELVDAKAELPDVLKRNNDAVAEANKAFVDAVKNGDTSTQKAKAASYDRVVSCHDDLEQARLTRGDERREAKKRVKEAEDLLRALVKESKQLRLDFEERAAA